MNEEINIFNKEGLNRYEKEDRKAEEEDKKIHDKRRRKVEKEERRVHKR